MAKQMGRPPINPDDRRPTLSCRVSAKAYRYVQSDSVGNISHFVDACILAAIPDAPTALPEPEMDIVLSVAPDIAPIAVSPVKKPRKPIPAKPKKSRSDCAPKNRLGGNASLVRKNKTVLNAN